MKHSNSQQIRREILAKWHKSLSGKTDLYTSDNISGTSPPSVFIGTFNYPKVLVGPMLPPEHGDTSLLDSPEKWAGKELEEIVQFRLNLIRGVKPISITQTDGRYIEQLQEVAMSNRPADADLSFKRPVTGNIFIDDQNAPFGPIGNIKDAKFSARSPVRQIEKAFYDIDLKAHDAIMFLYNSEIEISRIQRCLSVGMLGTERKLVPTKWGITATDDIISSELVKDVLEYPLIDSCKVYRFEHLGNIFVVVLFPHRWIFEMIEAWYSSGDVLGFGSDYEGVHGMRHQPAIAGAYFAAKLGAAEYLQQNQIQAGVVVLREIRPEYAIPVGVWQVREGVRSAMKQKPIIADNLEHGLLLASQRTSITKDEWMLHSKIIEMVHQKVISDFF